MKVQFRGEDEIIIGQNEAKKITQNTAVTSNRTVVGLQITIYYNENDFDIITYRKNEIKEFTQTLAAIKTKIETLKKD